MCVIFSDPAEYCSRKELSIQLLLKILVQQVENKWNLNDLCSIKCWIFIKMCRRCGHIQISSMNILSNTLILTKRWEYNLRCRIL